MKKTGRKLFALLLAFVMLAAAVPFSAAAEDEFELEYSVRHENYNPNTGEYDDYYVHITGYTGEAVGEITIPDEIGGNPVTTIREHAFRGADKITKIKFGKNVFEINESAFEGCVGLTELTVPGNVGHIDKKAFAGCTSLKSVKIGEGFRKLWEDAFKDCTALESVELPESLEQLDGFEGCSSLKTINIPSGITVIKDFEGCSSLESITLPEGTKEIPTYAFKDCTSLKKIVIPEKVRVIGVEAFKNCTSLAEIVFSEHSHLSSIGFDAFTNTAFYNDKANWEDGVFYLGNCAVGSADDISGKCKIKDNTTVLVDRLFENRKGITEVILPEGVRTIGNDAFLGCEALEKVEFPSTDIGYLGSGAFLGCLSLKKVVIYSVDLMSKDTFFNCPSLEDITIIKGNPNCSTIDGVLFTSSETTLECYPEAKAGKTYVIPEHVRYIGQWAFGNNQNIKTLVIPEGVSSIGADAFRRMKSLKYINLPKGITKINTTTFAECPSLEYISIPENVKYIDRGAFSYCENLRSVALSEGLETIDMFAFCGCPNLKKIAVPKSVTGIYAGAFGFEEFEQYTSKKVEGFTIYGYSGTAAERYATSYKFDFKDISRYVPDPVPEPEPDEEPEPQPPVDPSEDCDCRCHKGGIQNFIYKIFRIFWKIFKTNEYCKCGAKHY